MEVPAHQAPELCDTFSFSNQGVVYVYAVGLIQSNLDTGVAFYNLLLASIENGRVVGGL